LNNRKPLHQDATSPWLLNCTKGAHSPRLRLICFPFAGGSANTYRPWADKLPKDVELLAVQLPGRGTRFNEPCIAELPELIKQLVAAIKPFMQMPCVFFGHSMGAIIAYELCVALNRQHEKLPKLLMLSACSAPQLAEQNKALHSLPTKKFWQEVAAINGTQSEILNNSELLDLLEPSLRADFKIVYDWRQRSMENRPPTVPVAMEVFGGRNDTSVNLEQINGWKNYSQLGTNTHLFDGDHFFITHAGNAFFSALSVLLAATG